MQKHSLIRTDHVTVRCKESTSLMIEGLWFCRLFQKKNKLIIRNFQYFLRNSAITDTICSDPSMTVYTVDANITSIHYSHTHTKNLHFVNVNLLT
jgi:hypothetical protein